MSFLAFILAFAFVGYVFLVLHRTWGSGSEAKQDKKKLDTRLQALNLTPDEAQLVTKTYIPYSIRNYPYILNETVRLYLTVIGPAVQRGYKLDNVEQQYAMDSSATAVLNKYTFKKNNFKADYSSTRHYTEIMESIKQHLDPSLQLPPDEEYALNEEYPTRWRTKFGRLTEETQNDARRFFNGVKQLASENPKAQSVSLLYYEAYLHIARTNKAIAAQLYVMYVGKLLTLNEYKLKSVSKTMQNVLFSNSRQQESFNTIISNLLKDKDTDMALERMAGLFRLKRRKIELDIDAIQEARSEHTEVVGILSQYLDDEPAAETAATAQPQPVQQPVIQSVTPQPATTPVQDDDENKPPLFSSRQTELIALFAQHNYTLTNGQINTFAHAKGVFANGLVEGINEIFYDELDDALIEHDGETYTLNQDYYKQISAT